MLVDASSVSVVVLDWICVLLLVVVVVWAMHKYTKKNILDTTSYTSRPHNNDSHNKIHLPKLNTHEQTHFGRKGTCFMSGLS